MLTEKQRRHISHLAVELGMRGALIVETGDDVRLVVEDGVGRVERDVVGSIVRTETGVAVRVLTAGQAYDEDHQRSRNCESDSALDECPLLL